MTGASVSSFPTRARSLPGTGWLLFGLAFVLGFCNFPLRVVGWDFRYLPGDGVDNRLNNFILEHGYRTLRGQEQSFWDAPDFYPVHNTTAFSDTHLGMLPLYALLRELSCSPERAFQGWFVIPFALNFAAAAWALYRLGAGAAGVAAGAALFAFGVPISAQFGHAQLLPRFLVPIAVVLGWEYLRCPRTSSFVLFCFCVVYQIYVGVYIGYFLLLLLAAGLVTTLLRYSTQLHWRQHWAPGRKIWLTRLAIIGLSVLLLVPLGWVHAHGIGSVGTEYVRYLAPPLAGWHWPANVALATPLFTEPGEVPEGEHRVFPGVIALGALLVVLLDSLRSSRLGSSHSVASVAAWSSLLVMLLVTVFPAFWLYEPLTKLPGGCSIRAIGRVVLVLLFPLGITVAYCVDAVVECVSRTSRTLALIVASAAIGLISADQWLCSTDGERASAWKGERTAHEWLIARQERIRKAVLQHPGATLVYVLPQDLLSSGQDPAAVLVSLQLDAMRACQDLGIPCVNGYSGYFPKGWDYFLTREEVRHWLDENDVPAERMSGLVIIEIAVGP